MSDVHRCRKSIAACAAGSKYIQSMYRMVTRIFGIFAATSSLSGPDYVSPKELEISHCVVLYSMIQLIAFVATMHALWLNEHSSRIEFLARTDAVDVEWRLEKLRNPPKTEKIIEAVEIFGTLVIFSFILSAAVPEFLRWWPPLNA